MEIPPSDAVKHIPFIVLGIWPVNVLTLLAKGHLWTWDATPEAIVGLWEWGLFVSLSLIIVIELGGKVFIALAERRRRIEQAKAEGREEGRKEAERESRREAQEMLMILNAAARTNPDLLPSLLQEYQEKYQNGSAAA